MADLFDTETSGLVVQKKELRPHQVRALAMIRNSLSGLPEGKKRIVLQAPTGFGKTLVSAKIIEGALAKGNRVIFTAPAVSLINQTVRALEAEGIRDIGVMQADHPRTDRRAAVQVASVETLARRDVPNAALVLVDECHVYARAVDKLLTDRPDLFAIGLSATPWRAGMGRLWQDLVIPSRIGDLIREGFLSQFQAFAPDVPDLSGVKVTAGKYSEEGLEKVMGNAKLMASVVETWLAKGENRPTLAFCVNRAHARAVCEDFQRAGVSAAYVDGDTDMTEREIVNGQFVRGEVRIICSVRTMIAGVDLPVSCIIDAAPTRSEMMHVQRWGRGLRVNPGTEDLVVLDHAGNCLRLGLPTDINYEKLDDTAAKNGQSERKPKADRLPTPCPKCEALFSGRECPLCGHERKGMFRVEAAAGNLVAVGGKVKPPTMAEKQAFYSGLLWIGAERGYKPGWAFHKYKDRFGVEPSHMLVAKPERPSLAVLNWVKSEQIRWAKSRASERGAA